MQLSIVQLASDRFRHHVERRLGHPICEIVGAGRLRAITSNECVQAPCRRRDAYERTERAGLERTSQAPSPDRAALSRIAVGASGREACTPVQRCCSHRYFTCELKSTTAGYSQSHTATRTAPTCRTADVPRDGATMQSANLNTEHQSSSESLDYQLQRVPRKSTNPPESANDAAAICARIPRAASPGRTGALGPPMLVRTQPGWTTIEMM
jgi:hypothetical protein